MFRPARGPLLVQTLAVCLARRAFPEVEFVTDRRGADLAAALGWKFGNVNLALERLDDPGLLHIWALGKFLALLEQSGPCVHVDGDVLLFKPLRAKLEAGRLIAQSPDVAAYYLGDDMLEGLRLLGLPAGARPYNAGLLGGADVPLVHDYAHASLELAERFRGLVETLNGTTASMLVEQYHLGAFAARRRAAVRTLLPEAPTRRQMILAGYAHLIGSHKRHPFYVGKVEARLARDFPEAYACFLAGWPTVDPSPAAGCSSPVETVWGAAL